MHKQDNPTVYEIYGATRQREKYPIDILAEPLVQYIATVFLPLNISLFSTILFAESEIFFLQEWNIFRDKCYLGIYFTT